MPSHDLLLLPGPPSDTSDASINAAYGPAVRSIINSTQGRGSRQPALLDIAIQCDREETPDVAPRSYEFLEKIIACLYSFIIHACSENGSSREYEDIPDVAVFFVELYSGGQAQLSTEDQTRRPGPVIPLKTLAYCQRAWTTVYYLDGDAGERLVHAFSEQRRPLGPPNGYVAFQLHRLPGGTSLHRPSSDLQSRAADDSKRHRSVAVGGTFDHIHAGHKLLLTATTLALERKDFLNSGQGTLTIGITGDELLKNKKYAQYLESWEQRQQTVYSFLSRILNFGVTQADERSFNVPGPNGRGTCYTFGDGLIINCVELSDPFGPTITDEAISALVVSAETRSGGQAVNDKRKEKGWNLLEVFEVDVLDTRPRSAEAENEVSGAQFQSKISSTEIRRQLQERAGDS